MYVSSRIYLERLGQEGWSQRQFSLMRLASNILKMKRRRKFIFGENAFQAFTNILVNSEKLGLNALFKKMYGIPRSA